MPEAWKQQFGVRNAALYLLEIGKVSSNPDEMKDLIGRVSTIASGGIKEVTIDLDVALALTGTGAALRALLAKRVSLATAEGAGARVGKHALVEGVAGAKGIQIAPGKFAYLFGHVSSSSHNAACSNQLALEMKRLGVPDNAAGRHMLTEHLSLSA